MTPTPPIVDCWRDDARTLEEWIASASQDEVMREVVATEQGDEWVVTDAWHKSRMHDRSIDVSVGSVLVPTETSRSYARMLASYEAGDAAPPQAELSYHVTLRDSDRPEDARWDVFHEGDTSESPPFSLSPVSVRVHQELHYNGLDPYWPSLGRSFYVPSHDLVAGLALVREPVSLRWRRGNRVVVRGQLWDDERPGAEGPSEGCRLLVRRDALLRVLVTTARTMVSWVLLRKWAGGPRDTIGREWRQHAWVIALRPDGTTERWMASSSSRGGES